MTIATRAVARLINLRPAETHDVTVERDAAVKMTDGTILLADRWYPRSPTATTAPPPVILIRCPYGRRLIGIVGRLFAERGYQVVIQSTRGTFGSGGVWEPFRYEASDGADTLSWISAQPWSGEAIATWGPSYLGLTQWSVAHNPPASLKAIVPIVTASYFRNLMYPGESFALETTLAWIHQVEHQEEGWRGVLRSLVRGSKVVERAASVLPLSAGDTDAVGHHVGFYQDWLAHNGPDDAWWEEVNFGKTPSQVPPAALVGGWYDIFLPGQIADYVALVEAGRTARLTIGPWVHGSGGVARESVREGLAWFDAHLKGLGERRRAPVRLFVMGAKRWAEVESWPPLADVQHWHLRAGGRLLTSPPGEEGPDGYRFDPTDPTPGLGGASLNGRTAGPKDQQAREARRDVLTFTTDALTKDLTVAGPLTARIYFRSTAPSTDIFLRLCDVDPGGKSTNLSDGIRRVTGDGAVDVAMWPTANTFLAGHRIRLQVSSGAHPLYARNLGNVAPLASAVEMRPADIEILHDAEHPSGIDLPVAAI